MMITRVLPGLAVTVSSAVVVYALVTGAETVAAYRAGAPCEPAAGFVFVGVRDCASTSPASCDVLPPGPRAASSGAVPGWSGP